MVHRGVRHVFREKKFVCDHCGFRAIAKRYLELHMYTHIVKHEEKKEKKQTIINCVPCGVSVPFVIFYSKHVVLRSHVKKVKNYKCPGCLAMLQRWTPAHMNSDLHLGS